MSHLAITAHAIPRRVFAPFGVLATLASEAIAPWNALRPGLFVFTADSSQADVTLRLSTDTWVQMGQRCVIHFKDDDYSRFWLPHEFGHALGFGDHIFPNDDPSRYLNPVVCGPDDPYEGVMSYRSSRDYWFGPDDLGMVMKAYPLPRRVVLPFVSA